MLCPTALQAQAVQAAGVMSKQCPLFTRLQCCLQQDITWNLSRCASLAWQRAISHY